MSGNWMDDPEAQSWAKRTSAELVPMIRDSGATISIVPSGPSDMKFAVELGLSIMMDKPIILAVPPGTVVPDKLVRVADAIVEVDLSGDDLAGSERLKAAIDRVLGEE